VSAAALGEMSVEGERESGPDDCRREHEADGKVAQTAPECLFEHRSLPWILWTMQRIISAKTDVAR